MHKNPIYVRGRLRWTVQYSSCCVGRTNQRKIEEVLPFKLGACKHCVQCQGGSEFLECHKFVQQLSYGNILIPRNGKIQTTNTQDVQWLCSKDLISDPKIQRILKFYKGKICPIHFSIISSKNYFLAKIESTGEITEVQTLLQTPRSAKLTYVIF